MKIKIRKVLACILAPITLLAACNVMDSNTAHAAEDDDSNADEWAEYAAALITDITLASTVPKADAIRHSVEFAIASTIPLATASDVSLFNGVTEFIGDYVYTDEWAVDQYVICNIGGNSRVLFSDALHQEDIVTYPWGSTAYYTFVENGAMWLSCNNSGCQVLGSNINSMGYTAPDPLIVYQPFSIWYGGGSPDTCVRKYQGNQLNSGVLCSFISMAVGADHKNFYDWYMGTEHGFLFPEVDPDYAPYITPNEYLTMVYEKYEEDFGVPFEYTEPDLLPTGLMMPDGTVTGDDQSGGDGDVNVNVEVEFPTIYVPNVLEPTYYDYDTLQTEVIVNPDDSVIKDSWLEGFGALITSMLYTMTAFQLDDVVILLAVFGLVLILLVRW